VLKVSREETRQAVECILHDYDKLSFDFTGERLAIDAGKVDLLFYVEENFQVSILENFTLSGICYQQGVCSLDDFESICKEVNTLIKRSGEGLL